MRSNKINSILTKWYFQLGILLVTLFLFLIFRNPIFGFLVGIELMVMVIFEIKYGAKKHGWKHELLDTVIALFVALFIWYLASFLLNTGSPLSAVASCSMLSNLQRGDFVVVQGSKINAHEISMTEAGFAAIKDDAIIFYGDKQLSTVKGSIYSYCNSFSGDSVCREFINAPEQFIEKKGPLTFHYSRCELATEAGLKYVPCVTSVDYAGKDYKQSFDNDIIVYTPTKGDIFSVIGDIVHRSYFKITTDTGNVYYLSKGDNNPVFDIQFYDYKYNAGNSPVNSNNVKGKVVTRIPYLGYFKLLITPAIDHKGQITSLGVMDIEQCKTQLKP